MTTSLKGAITTTVILRELSVPTKEVGTKENVIKTRDFKGALSPYLATL